MVTYTDKLIRDCSKYSDLNPLSKVIIWILAGKVTVTERLCRVVCEAIFSQLTERPVLLHETWVNRLDGKKGSILLHRQVECDNYICTAKTWRQLVLRAVSDLRWSDLLDQTTVIHINH